MLISADHDRGVYPQSAVGNPFTAEYIAVKGNPVVDLKQRIWQLNKRQELLMNGLFNMAWFRSRCNRAFKVSKRKRSGSLSKVWWELLRIGTGLVCRNHFICVMPKPDFRK